MGRGFTLVELMVVIGIMALVVAIVLPAANSLLTTSRANQTLATMHVLENAIDCYAQDRPLQNSDPDLREVICNTLPIRQKYQGVFGQYPPSPTAEFARPGDPLVLCPYTVEGESGPDSYATDTITSTKFLHLLDIYLDLHMVAVCRPIEDYVSIECLLVFLSRLCPQAKQIVDLLPSSAIKNIDSGKADLVYKDLNGNGSPDPNEQLDLFEVVDAWKRPIRYTVKPPVLDPTTCEEAFPAIWELRSAGPDGFFSAPWTDEDKSDDVILRSQ